MRFEHIITYLHFLPLLASVIFTGKLARHVHVGNIFSLSKESNEKGKRVEINEIEITREIAPSVIFISTIFLFIPVHSCLHIFKRQSRKHRLDRYLDGWNSKCFSFRVPLARETVKSQVQREDVLLMIRFELFASSRKVPLRLFQSVHQKSYTKFL